MYELSSRALIKKYNTMDTLLAFSKGETDQGFENALPSIEIDDPRDEPSNKRLSSRRQLPGSSVDQSLYTCDRSNEHICSLFISTQKNGQNKNSVEFTSHSGLLQTSHLKP